MNTDKPTAKKSELLDMVWTKNIIELLEITSENFDADSVFKSFAEKVCSSVKCKKITYKIFERIHTPEKLQIFGELEDEIEYSCYKGNIYVKDSPVGELSIFYDINVVDEHIDEYLDVVLSSFQTIVRSFFERAEFQESHMKTIVSALASDYGNITYVDLINGTDMIIKANNSGVLVKDDQDQLSYAQRLVNYITNFVIPEEREEMAYALSIPAGIENTKDGKMYSVSCRILIDGKIHYRNVKFVPQMENGRVVSMVIGFHSTDSEHMYQEQLEEALKQAKVANNAKSSFLFNMSHDIRTPMNAIIGLTAMAKKHIKEEEKTKDYLNKISTSGEQLLNLINKVLEMSRIESGKISINNKEFDLIEKIQTNVVIFRELCEQKGLRLSASVEGIKHPNIFSDPDRIDQILNNLLGNAHKYTFEGGSVSLTVYQENSDKPNTCLSTFVIKDTGMGMSPEFVSHIFDEFSRESTSTVSHIEGSGLGMSIVKRIVDLLGGTITVDSVKGKGTTITFTLETPYDDEKINKEEKKEMNALSLSGLKVLLAEDNLLNREITTELLSEYGIIITPVNDGEEAVEAIKNSDEGGYAAILMDIQMPRMDGYEATKIIRTLPNGKSIPIIALSANAFEEDKKKSIEVGMNDHVAKPININELVGALAKFL